MKRNWTKLIVSLFLVLSLVMLYINIGRDSLFDWDEGIYATLGSEMIKSGDIFTPTWNQSAWFEKPPGIAWLSGFGQLVAGHTELGSRLFQPVVTVATLYLIYLLGVELISLWGGIAAMGLLAGFNLFLGRARGVNADMPLLLGIAATAYLLLKDKKPVYVALAISLSVWFKGVAGLLPVLIALPLFLTKNKSYILSSIAYTLLFSLPWHLFALFRYREIFYQPYFFEQVLTRVTSPIEFHLESRWFYLEYLYNNLGLGVIIVTLLGLALSLREYFKTRTLKNLLLSWWIFLPIAIFTLSRTRLFWYILPVYPAIALSCAYALEHSSSSKNAKKLLAAIAIFIGINGLVTLYKSVEPGKTVSEIPSRIIVASELSASQAEELAVLVPPAERIAEAVLPHTQRISSSFRYGGMPSVVYYYDGPVKFFYNVDDFNEYWRQVDRPIAMITRDDRELITSPFEVIVDQGEYLGITKGIYANR